MKSKLLRSLVLALLAALLLLTVGCGELDENAIPENMHSVTVDGAYCRLVVPIDWNSMTDMGVTGAYISSKNYASIFVHDYENPDGLTPKAYAEQVHIAELAASYDMGAIAVSDGELDGKSACVLEYSATREQVTYRVRTFVCAHRDRIWTLTYIAQYELFDSYLSVLDNVTVNFRFLDEPYREPQPLNTVDTSAKAPEGMMLASSDDVAYRFYVPNNWVLDTALPTSSAYVSETDRSNVNVTVYMPRESAHIADYYAMCAEQYKTTLTDYTEISADTGARVADRVAHIYVFTATVNGIPMRFAQTITIQGGMFYTITYTATEEAFDSHYAEYEQILAAFTFR